MPWTSFVLQLGGALPYLLGLIVGAYVLVLVVASMVAIWHPTASRRAAAYKVLALLVGAIRPPGSDRRKPPP